MTSHRLDPAPATTRDVFSRAHAPMLTVDPGDTVTVGSLDASGHLARQRFPGEDRPRMIPEARGHCLMTTEAVIGLAAGRPVGSIHAEAPSGRITFGFEADLNVAMGDALDAMVTWLETLTGLQVANQSWGVHAVLPTGVLGPPG